MNSTEATSYYSNLENASLSEILQNINNEDKKVAFAVEKAIHEIEELIKQIIPKIKKGGRLFYVGAGTSGRLGILDAAECYPTFGLKDVIIGIIAGGTRALSEAIENAEDDFKDCWQELLKFNVSIQDFVLGISSSGSTPFVLGALNDCKTRGITTGCITCNLNTEIEKIADFPVKVIVGPEFVTGSTRMKSGTATKMILNMISTSVMISLGRVEGNEMVEMKIMNRKLKIRACHILIKKLNITYSEAFELISKHKSIKTAINFWLKK